MKAWAVELYYKIAIATVRAMTRAVKRLDKFLTDNFINGNTF